MRGVRLVRRFAGPMDATVGSRHQRKRESDRSFDWFVSRLAGVQKADWFGDRLGWRNEHVEAQVLASMTLSNDASGCRASGRQVRESDRPLKPIQRAVSESDHSQATEGAWM